MGGQWKCVQADEIRVGIKTQSYSVCVCVYNMKKKSLTALIGFVLGKEMLIYCPAGDFIPIITDPGIGNSPGRKTSSIGWTSRDGQTDIQPYEEVKGVCVWGEVQSGRNLFRNKGTCRVTSFLAGPDQQKLLQATGCVECYPNVMKVHYIIYSYIALSLSLYT